MKSVVNNTLARIMNIGADPDDDHDIRLQKSLLVLCALPFLASGFAWGVLYMFFGQWLAGSIPMSYGFFSMLSIAHFGVTGQYRFFRFSQLFLILLLPFLLMVALGGFVSGSAVVVWALICPLGALLFGGARQALVWFTAYVFLIILSGFIQPYHAPNSSLSTELIIFFFVINFVGLSSIIFLMVFHFVGLKNTFQEKSDALLLNILPKEIADILRNESRTIADYFEGARVLFADVVNFTEMSASMSPGELVSLLDEVFSHFDQLVDNHDLEKIKTIGDCYMVASGVPRPRADHAQTLTQLALEMQGYVEHHTFSGRKLSFRIGLNSGPVVAGVIGRKKFIYDLWGDVVNTASRMESHGRKGEIQITRATYDLIKDQFTCSPRGKVSVKGKGELSVWTVDGMSVNPA